MKDDYCKGAKRRPVGSYLQQIDAEACTDGWRYNAGDAANFAIGQGDVTVSPFARVFFNLFSKLGTGR